MRKVCRGSADVAGAAKSAPWKLAVAAALKARITATNRWLAEALALGNRFEMSLKVNALCRQPDRALAKKVGLTTNHKA